MGFLGTGLGGFPGDGPLRLGGVLWNSISSISWIAPPPLVGDDGVEGPCGRMFQPASG